jgi:hypothetical protein
VLDAQAMGLLAEVNAYGPAAGLSVLMLVSYILGFVLVGIAKARAGALSRRGEKKQLWSFVQSRQPFP